MSKKEHNLPTAPSLVGKKVFLRPTTALDVANFHHWFLQSEPQSQSCRPLVTWTAEEAAELFKKHERTTDRQSYTVCRTEDKTPVGRIRYFDYNSLNRSAELGVLIDPDEHKNGYGSEAIKLLVSHLFQYRGLNKVYAETAEFNEGAVKLLESLGFKLDGTLRDHYFYEGKFHNRVIYSLLLYELDW